MTQAIEAQAIVEEVKGYIVRNILIGVSDEPLQPDDSFLQKGILNSTGVLELVEFLEQHYGFRCGDNEITPENLDSLQAIAAYVLRKLAQSSPGTSTR